MDRAELLIQRAEAAGSEAHAAEIRQGGTGALASLARAFAVITALKASLRQLFLRHSSPAAFAPTQPADLQPSPSSHVVRATMGVGGLPVTIEYDLQGGAPCILGVWFDNEPPYLGDLDDCFTGWQIEQWERLVAADARAHALDDELKPVKSRTAQPHNLFLARPYKAGEIKGGA